jgi:hypothetical protein
MSGYTTTPRYALKKPTVGADDDLWGSHLNSNADVIDNMAPLDSPVFTGNPQAPTPTAGDADTSIATTAFVQNAVGAVPGGATIAPTPPALNPGALWWDSTGGQLYVRYNDGNSTQWTAATTLQGQAGVATTSYVDTAVSTAQRNVGRNLIHNGQFTVAQRGVGPWAVQGYTLDRWAYLTSHSNGAFSVTQTALADADRAAIGDEAARFGWQNVLTGGTGAGDYDIVVQTVEDVRRLSGKTVLVSFWARAAAGTPKVAIELSQNFGSGGSPSASTFSVGAQAFTLSTTWTRYTSSPIAVPSSAGKTFGTTAGTDYTQFLIWQSSGTTNAARASNIGVQSGTFQLWGVQLEIAAAGQVSPTPLEKMDAQQTLAVCQRFYQTGQMILRGYQPINQPVWMSAPLVVSMRSSTITTGITTNGSSNITGQSLTANGYCLILHGTATVAGDTLLNIVFSASADL